MTDAQPTPEQVLALSLRWNRERMHLTAQELADRVSDLGGKISRQAIGSIELGKRDVRVDELLFLARALGVNPLVLLFPIGVDFEAVPEVVNAGGKSLEMWEAAKWFTGEDPSSGDVAEQWAVPLHLFRAHDKSLGDLALAVAAEIWPPEDGSADPEGMRLAAEFELRSIRGRMRKHGLIPPMLEADLKYIDDLIHRDLSVDQVERILEKNPNARVTPADSTKPGKGRPIRPGQVAAWQRQLGVGRRLVFELAAADAAILDHPDE